VSQEDPDLRIAKRVSPGQAAVTADTGARGLGRLRRTLELLHGERGRLALSPVHGGGAAVLRFSAAGKYVLVHATTGSSVVRESLAALAARLDPERFVRVHRSDIVRVDAVDRLEPSVHGDAVLVFADGTTAILSRTYRKYLLARFRPR